MRVLGIESSSLVASVALITDDILTAEYTVDFKKTHSQTLLPMLDEIVKMMGLDLETIDAIAAAGGPGSFTGLRIGAATAKGLGLALKKPLIHVPTVDALAYNMWGASGLICPIMDAKRSQVYTGLYHMENGIEKVMEQCPMDMGELIEQLNKQTERVIFLGDGVPVYKSMIQEKLTAPYVFAPAQMNRQRASCVAALGIQEPKYSRLMNLCLITCASPRQRDRGKQRHLQMDKLENFQEIIDCSREIRRTGKWVQMKPD